MKRLSYKFIRLLLIAALIPIAIFGAISIYSSRKVAYERVVQGNQNVARRAASEIEIYLKNSVDTMKTLADNLSNVNLNSAQKERIIKNYVIDYGRLEEILLVDQRTGETISSRPENDFQEMLNSDEFKIPMGGRIYFSDVFISSSLAPMMKISVPVLHLNRVVGALIGNFNLIDMWELVDSIRIGDTGFAFVVTDSGRLIAHGNDNRKADVIRGDKLSGLPLFKPVFPGEARPVIYREKGRAKVLSVASEVVLPDGRKWVVAIEQSTAEAFRAVRLLTIELAGLILVFLVVMSLIGYLGGKRIADPLSDLISATGMIARGDLDARVRIESRDELADLGDSFNKMAEKLGDLTEEIRKKERVATFGRIAAGLAHDLRHPIQNIQNATNFLNQKPDDPEIRKAFRNTVEREFRNINEFLDRLRNLTGPSQVQIIDIKVNGFLSEILKIYREDSSSQGLEWLVEFNREDPVIRADRFVLERAIKNILTNAIEAVNGKGKIKVTTGKSNNLIFMEISDSGPGIPAERLKSIFDDFTTTKRKGLGLGLATARKLVEEIGGQIELDSQPGQGTKVMFVFPANG
ncbi:MAG: ATP-binding protein [Proteobacteria bacterium]|nr:ATP-binding protein [Pseudomonadota bacterium]